MKKGALFVFLIVFAVGIGFWIQRAYQPQQQAIPDPLLVGISADYKPFTFREDNTIQGFEIDLIQEVTRRLGVSYELHDLTFEVLLMQLRANSLHVVASGLSSTPERREQVNFSQPYLIEDPLYIVTLADKHQEVHGIEDLYNKTVIVNQGYTAESYMQQFPYISLLPLHNVSDAILALNAEKAYAFVTAAHTMKPVFEQYGYETFHVVPLQDVTETISLALSKQYPELQKAIDEIITQLHQEGFITQLKHTWNIS